MNWLNEGERSVLTMEARDTMRKLIAGKMQYRFHEKEGDPNTPPYYLMVTDPYAPAMVVRLIHTDDRALYDTFADQLERYIAFLTSGL